MVVITIFKTVFHHVIYSNNFFLDFGGTTVECRCPLGFSGDGIGPNGCHSTSAVGSHICSGGRCKNGGTCIQETVFNHHCLCPALFTGLFCFN